MVFSINPARSCSVHSSIKILLFYGTQTLLCIPFETPRFLFTDIDIDTYIGSKEIKTILNDDEIRFKTAL